MPANLNLVALVGYLCSEVELREIKTQNERKQVVGKFTLFVPGERFGPGKQRAHLYMEVECFGQLAVQAGRQLKRGAALAVEGALRRRKWKGRDDVVRISTWVEAREVSFITREGNPSKKQRKAAALPAENAAYTDDEYVERDFEA